MLARRVAVQEGGLSHGGKSISKKGHCELLWSRRERGVQRMQSATLRTSLRSDPRGDGGGCAARPSGPRAAAETMASGPPGDCGGRGVAGVRGVKGTCRQPKWHRGRA